MNKLILIILLSLNLNTYSSIGQNNDKILNDSEDTCSNININYPDSLENETLILYRLKYDNLNRSTANKVNKTLGIYSGQSILVNQKSICQLFDDIKSIKKYQLEEIEIRSAEDSDQNIDIILKYKN